MIDALAGPGRTVLHCATAADFFRRIAQARPAAFVVDWRLPDMDGGQVIQRLRQLYGRSLPLIVITSDRHEGVALTALALDADDFVYKPVSRPILRARFEAVLRRFRKDAATHDELRLAPYTLNLRTQQATVGSERVLLKAREFDLAWALFSNPHRFMSRTELLASVWGADAQAHSHSLAQHIYSLRRKLDLARHGFHLATVYGAGYRFDPPAVAATAGPDTLPGG